jgi:hypothetical protein
MKIRREMMVLLAASGLLVGSCASKEPPVQVVQSSSVPAQTAVAEKSTTSVKAVEDDMRSLSSQINTTNAALNGVILARGTPAAKGAFDTFSASVTQLEKTALPFFKDSDQMTTRGTDYFDEWKVAGSTYINPQIQSLSGHLLPVHGQPDQNLSYERSDPGRDRCDEPGCPKSDQ